MSRGRLSALFLFSFFFSGSGVAATPGAIKLRVSLLIGKNERATETLLVQSGKWETKKLGTYSFKVKALPYGKDGAAVKVDMEMGVTDNAGVRKSTVIEKWDYSHSIESKDDKGQLQYFVSIAASKMKLDGSVLPPN